jgi:murein DD-endopeptidase MepM/ murein hydrolase activator NlpD
MHRQYRFVVAFILGLMLLPSWFGGANFVAAQSEIEKLQAQIAERSSRLTEIDAEIKKFEAALKEVGAEKNTLQRAINQLELERKKVQADIAYTEAEISAADLTINKLTLEISDTERRIATGREAIGGILREMRTIDDETLIEVLLRQDNLAEFWNEVESLETVKSSIASRADALRALRDSLDSKRALSAEERELLASLKDQYSDQQLILAGNKATKEDLLMQTRSEEKSYQAILAEKKAAKDKLLAEVSSIESQIKFILDPNKIPTKGSAVFRWPLDKPYITQYFGYTKFALSGAYNGSAHNGVDMGTPVGTKIYAPLTGTVRNIGNTDAVPGCYSWGKWVLIDHPNGLSSMFAHLSQQSVVAGQVVQTGDVVGYSGNTGYSTGPHLHYTVYVSDGVKVQQFNQYKSVTSCGAALSPFAAIEAYVNPMDYLPPL